MRHSEDDSDQDKALVKKFGGAVTYTVKTADKQDAILAGASCSDTGKLQGVETVTQELSAAEEKSDTLNLPAGKKVKLMLLEKSTYAPLTEAWTNCSYRLSLNSNRRSSQNVI